VSKEASQTETPQPEEAAAETDIDLAAFVSEVRDGFEKIGQIMAVQQDQLTALQDKTPSQVTYNEPEPEGLPDGTVRFFSPYREYGIVIKSGGRYEVDGRVVIREGKRVDFSNGIYDTNDPETIEFLRTHAAHGKEFVESPDAQPHAGPQVVDGPKTTGSSQRQPQPELSARL